MKVVFLRKNNFIKYKIYNLNGYIFNPRNKKINYLNIVDEDLIKYILSKKIQREISKVKRAIKLMIKSNVTISNDCDIMLDELIKISKKLEKKYRIYFNEFEYFENVKELYVLSSVINLKKKIIREN